jgi:hypothetical protein
MFLSLWLCRKNPFICHSIVKKWPSLPRTHMSCWCCWIDAFISNKDEEKTNANQSYWLKQDDNNKICTE